MSDFGNRLKHLRNANNWNEAYVAKLLMIPLSIYVSYEDGTKEPDKTILIKVASLYNVSTDFLLGKSKYLNEAKGDKRFEADLTSPVHCCDHPIIGEEAVEVRNYVKELLMKERKKENKKHS